MAQQSILVVDDDATVRQLLTVVLASPDRRIDAASDGREALARIESTRNHLEDPTVPDNVLLWHSGG